MQPLYVKLLKTELVDGVAINPFFEELIDTHPLNAYLGRCLTNGEITYVNIPKCASTSLRELQNSGFKYDNYHRTNLKHTEFRAYLRDPVSRWRSAIKELTFRYFYHNYDYIPDQVEIETWFYDQHFETFFNRPIDIHIIPQTCYLLNLSNITLVKDFPIPRKNISEENKIKVLTEPLIDAIFDEYSVRNFYKIDFARLAQR